MYRAQILPVVLYEYKLWYKTMKSIQVWGIYEKDAGKIIFNKKMKNMEENNTIFILFTFFAMLWWKWNGWIKMHIKLQAQYLNR